MRCNINKHTFRGIPGFYSTSGYTAVISFSAHLDGVKCEVFTTTSTGEIHLCARPATLLTRSPTPGKSRMPVHCACVKI